MAVLIFIYLGIVRSKTLKGFYASNRRGIGRLYIIIFPISVAVVFIVAFNMGMFKSIPLSLKRSNGALLG
jgi:hypothetical protein